VAFFVITRSVSDVVIHAATISLVERWIASRPLAMTEFLVRHASQAPSLKQIDFLRPPCLKPPVVFDAR
jgi:hypothetical protein